MPANDPQAYQRAARTFLQQNGFPLTTQNLSSAVVAMAENPQLYQQFAGQQEQVNFSTGKTSLPEMFLGDDLAVAPGAANEPPQPAMRPSAPAVPGATSSPDVEAQSVSQQQASGQPLYVPELDDEFDVLPPTSGNPFLPLVAPAAVAGAAMNTPDADAMGMDIEGKRGMPGLPSPGEVKALPAPQQGQPFFPEQPNNPQLPSPEERVINMRDETSGATITPEASFEQKMDARGSNVIDTGGGGQVVRSRRTGALYYVSPAGEVLDNAGKPLNRNAAQALLRVVRKM